MENPQKKFTTNGMERKSNPSSHTRPRSERKRRCARSERRFWSSWWRSWDRLGANLEQTSIVTEWPPILGGFSIKKSGRQQSNVSLWWIATVEQNYTTWTCFFCCPFQLFGWCLLVFQVDSSCSTALSCHTFEMTRKEEPAESTSGLNASTPLWQWIVHLFLALNYPVTLDFFWRWVMILSVD